MTDSKPNLILIGLRASGKSTLGVLISQRLGRDFVDLDEITSRMLGASGAGEAIASNGVDAFREAEGEALRSVLKPEGLVIALGGGTPTAPGCAQLLEESQASGRCRVIYLRALPATLQTRLKASDNSDRPALVGDDAIDEVQVLFDQRDGLYREIAESVIHTDGVSEDSVMSALMAVVKSGV